jgi:hypothetical protein
MNLFEPMPNSQKVICTECGATGYDVDHPRSWQHAHRRGHAPCPRCGKVLTLLVNGKPRTHVRCPVRRASPYLCPFHEGESPDPLTCTCERKTI